MVKWVMEMKFVPIDLDKLSNFPKECKECKYLRINTCSVECILGNAFLAQPCKDHAFIDREFERVLAQISV